MLQRLSKYLISKTVWHVIGRRNMVRLGRFLSNEGRLDIVNDPTRNGESMVIANVISRHKGKGTPVCIFDVGANVGNWTKDLFRKADHYHVDAKVHAFEAFPPTYETLTSNLRESSKEQHVIANNMALSSEAGELDFFATGKDADGGTNSLHQLPSFLVGNKAIEVLKVPAVTIDEYCKTHGIERIHLLKIDTEGHDFEVISGAGGMMERGAIDVIQFEYNHRWIFARHFLKDVFSWMEPHGCSLGKVTRDGIEFYDRWHFELESFREGNYVVVRPELKDAFRHIQWWNE